MRRRPNSAAYVLLGSGWTQDFWLWAMPLVFIVGAFLFALFTIQVDRAIADGRLPLPWWAIEGASEAQTILSVVAGASISVLTLVFSSALVVLTLAASQFGSFLLHDFIRMRISRLTLSMFVATFVYSLTVLTRVGGSASNQFVPGISAKIAVLLVFASVILLIGFIYGVSISVQAQRVTALVAAGLRRAIVERQQANAVEAGTGAAGEPLPPDLSGAIQHLDKHSAPVAATESGYLQAVRFQSLVRAAQQACGIVRLAYRPGQFVLVGSTLAEVWPPELAATGDLAEAIRRAHVIGSQRTLEQDLEFAIDKLVQIALLALSPAINNTFNALICIDWLADSMRMLAEHPSDWRVYHDPRGALRVVNRQLPFTDVVADAFGRIRFAAGGNPTVTLHLLRTLARLAPWLRSPDVRAALQGQADQAATEALDVLKLPADCRAVRDGYLATCQALGHPPISLPETPVDGARP